MNISQTGINFIKRYEGLRLTPYKAVSTEEHLTIGYGHYGSDVKPDMKLTEKEAEDLLRKDLQRFVNGVNEAVKIEINQNQFDALVSFTYNCGVGALQKSTLLKYVNMGAFQEASLQFARWNKSGGNVLAGLTRRRSEEKELFLTPVKETTSTLPLSVIREIKRKALAGEKLINPTPEKLRVWKLYASEK